MGEKHKEQAVILATDASATKQLLTLCQIDVLGTEWPKIVRTKTEVIGC